MKMKLLPLLLLLLLLPAQALGAKLTDFSVTPASAEQADDLSAVSWYKDSKGNYDLFLPSSADPTQLKVWFSGPDTLTLNGTAVTPGTVTDCLVPGGTVTLKNGSKSYTLHVYQSANLPAVYITLASGSLTYIEGKKGREETGQILITDAEGTVLTEQPLTQMKCRGNSSFTFTKKNYQIKLESGKNLFGMGKSKTWILTGNYRDKSYLRNRITYAMASYAGMAYTPENCFVDLYVNGEYHGLYMFSEKNRVDNSRVAIADLEKATQAVNETPLEETKRLGSASAKAGQGKYYDIANDPEDITGGYLMELESYKVRYASSTSAYMTKKGMVISFHTPEYLSENQFNYITGLLQSFENAIFAADGVDPDTGKHYTEIADLTSLVRKYMIEEISKNYDGNNSSNYFYKPADEAGTLLYAGPCWDYDSAYGSYAQKHSKSILEPEGWYINSAKGKYWWPAMYKHTDFQEAVKATWQSTFRRAMNILLGEEKDPLGRILSIDEYADEIRASAAMDFLRWPRSKNPSTVAQTGATLDENLTFLKNFISQRRDWLDKQWGE